jgi:hypothetical protein
MATGVLHVVVGIILGKDILALIAADGWFNALQEQYDRNYIFWFLLSGFGFIPLGYLGHRYITELQRGLPHGVGWLLLILTLVCCMLIPVSGCWLLIPQVLIIFFSKPPSSIFQRL